jgi:aquaporin Z
MMAKPGHITRAEREAHVSAEKFIDPKREWRRLFAEGWGTFLLVLAAAGAAMVAAKTGGKVTPAAAAVAPGLMVMAVIYFMGAVSGAHVNPAVTLAFAARRNFPWMRVPGYIAAQFIGGILAVLFLRAVLGTAGQLGATMPHDIDAVSAFFLETVLTAGLVVTILGTAAGGRNVGANAAIAIGGYIALSGLWAGPITGAAMNPVRSLAPDIVRGDFSTSWVYVAGPLVGAMIAVGFEWILKGPPTREGTRAAQGK